MTSPHTRELSAAQRFDLLGRLQSAERQALAQQLQRMPAEREAPRDSPSRSRDPPTFEATPALRVVAFGAALQAWIKHRSGHKPKRRASGAAGERADCIGAREHLPAAVTTIRWYPPVLAGEPRSGHVSGSATARRGVGGRFVARSRSEALVPIEHAACLAPPTIFTVTAGQERVRWGRSVRGGESR